MEENKLAKIDNTEVAKFIAYDDVEQLRRFCEPFYKAITRFNSVEEVMSIALWAIDSKVSFIPALSHCFVVNGVVSIDSHMFRALIQSCGIYSETEEDYKPLYLYYINENQYVTQDDVAANPDLYQAFDNAAIAEHLHKQNLLDTSKITVIRAPKPYDYRTTIRFERWIGGKLMIERGQFCWDDAKQPGLDNKDTYKKYPKNCFHAKAYTFGARKIGADITGGMRHLLEEAEINNANVTVTEDGDFTILE